MSFKKTGVTIWGVKGNVHISAIYNEMLSNIEQKRKIKNVLEVYI